MALYLDDSHVQRTEAKESTLVNVHVRLAEKKVNH